jgi:hypothetical protein
MARKIIGTILLIIGGLLGFVLLMYGGPILPHIIGPAVLIVIGVILLTVTRNNK